VGGHDHDNDDEDELLEYEDEEEALRREEEERYQLMEAIRLKHLAAKPDPVP